MAKNDQQEAFDRLLSAMLARTIDFIKFAEAKNLALLTLSSAWIIATSSVALSDKALEKDTKVALYLSMTSFATAALLSIYALVPQLRLSKFLKDEFRPANLLYFGDVQRLEVLEFKEQVRRRYMPPDKASATEEYSSDLIEQIRVNSRIASRKFSFFNRSACFLLLGVATLSYPALSRLADALKAVYQ